MYRSIPVQNKIIAQKIHDHDRQLHLKKIQNMKSSINTKPPETYKHLGENKKKMQLREDKLTEIERENRILLNKMTTIIRSPQNREIIYSSYPVLHNSKSLNKDQRKRELVKITIENQMIAKRLQQKKSSYNVDEWIGKRKLHEQYLKNICEYPYSLYNHGGQQQQQQQQQSLTKYDNFNIHEARPQTFDTRRIRSEKYFNSTSRYGETETENIKPSSQGADWNPKKRLQKLDPISISSQPGLVQNVLYRGKKKIGYSNFFLEIFMDHDKNFTIKATNIDRYDIKKLVTSESEGLKILEGYQYNYEKIIEAIKFRGDKIILIEDDLKIPKAQEIKKINEKNIDKDNDIVEIPSDNDNEDSEASAILHPKQGQNISDDEDEKKEVENIFSKVMNDSKNLINNEEIIDHEEEINMEEIQEKQVKQQIEANDHEIVNKNSSDELEKPEFLEIPKYNDEELRHISENEEENEFEASTKQENSQKFETNKFDDINEFRIQRYSSIQKKNENKDIINNKDQQTNQLTLDKNLDNEDQKLLINKKILDNNSLINSMCKQQIDDIKNILSNTSNIQIESSRKISQPYVSITENMIEKFEGNINRSKMNNNNNTTNPLKKLFNNQKDDLSTMKILNKEYSSNIDTNLYETEMLKEIFETQNDFDKQTNEQRLTIDKETKRAINTMISNEDFNQTKRNSIIQTIDKISNVDKNDDNKSQDNEKDNMDKTKETLINQYFIDDFKNLKEEVFIIQNNLKYSESYNKKLEEALKNQSIEINKMIQNFMHLKEENEALKQNFNNLAYDNIQKNDCDSHQYYQSQKTKDIPEKDTEYYSTSNKKQNLEFIISKKCLKFYVEELIIQKSIYQKKLNQQQMIIQDLRKILEEKESFINEIKGIHMTQIEEINRGLKTNFINSSSSTILRNQKSNTKISPSSVYLKMDNEWSNNQNKVQDNIGGNNSLIDKNKYSMNIQGFDPISKYNQKTQTFKEPSMICEVNDMIFVTPLRSYQHEQVNLGGNKISKFDEGIIKVSTYGDHEGKVSPIDIKNMIQKDSIKENLNQNKNNNHQVQINSNPEALTTDFSRDIGPIEKQFVEIKDKKNEIKTSFVSAQNARQSTVQPNENIQFSNSHYEHQQQKTLVNPISNDEYIINQSKNRDKEGFKNKSPLTKNLLENQKCEELINEPLNMDMSFDASFLKGNKKKKCYALNSFSMSPIHNEKKSKSKIKPENLNDIKHNKINEINNLSYVNDYHQLGNELSITDSSINMNSKLLYDYQNPVQSYCNESKIISDQDISQIRDKNKQKSQNPFIQSRDSMINFNKAKDLKFNDENLIECNDLFKKEPFKFSVSDNCDYHPQQIDTKHIRYDLHNPMIAHDSNCNAMMKNVGSFNLIKGMNEVIPEIPQKNPMENQNRNVNKTSKNTANIVEHSHKKSNSLNHKDKDINLDLSLENNLDHISIKDNSIINGSIAGFIDANNTLISINNVLDKCFDSKPDSMAKSNLITNHNIYKNAKFNQYNIQEPNYNLRKNIPNMPIRFGTPLNKPQEFREDKQDGLKRKINETVEDETIKNNKQKHSKHRRIKSSTAVSPSGSIIFGYVSSNQQNNTIGNLSKSINNNNNHNLPNQLPISSSIPQFHQIDFNSAPVNPNGKLSSQCFNYNSQGFQENNKKVYNNGMNLEENTKNRNENRSTTISKVSLIQSPTFRGKKDFLNEPGYNNYQKFKKSDLVMDFHHLENVPILTTKELEKIRFPYTCNEAERNIHKQKNKNNGNHKMKIDNQYYDNMKIHKESSINNLEMNENCTISNLNNANFLQNYGNKKYNNGHINAETWHYKNNKKEQSNQHILTLSNHNGTSNNGCIVFHDITNNVETAHFKDHGYHSKQFDLMKNSMPLSNTEYYRKAGRGLRNDEFNHENDYLSRNIKLEKTKRNKEIYNYDKFDIERFERDRIYQMKGDKSIKNDKSYEKIFKL